MSSDRMNFQERFKGRTSIMDKGGIDGMVKLKAMPIEKDLKTTEIFNASGSPLFSRSPAFSLKSLP